MRGRRNSTAEAAAEAPTHAIVEAALKGNWDNVRCAPRQLLTLNKVTFGEATVATALEVQIEGVLEGLVTPAIVDFTLRTYYDSHTEALRRVREAVVCKDKMGGWAMITGNPKGEDITTEEPAAK